ncbi:MAG: glycosyltransferase family 87 protein, partial [Pyrinomonadaceae bacterium]
MKRLKQALSNVSGSCLTNLSLVMIGFASLALYIHVRDDYGRSGIAWFIRLTLLQAVLYLIATWLISCSRSARSTLIIVIAFAALFRLSILFAPPYLSGDIYRYIWDGRVQAAGINPYRYIPEDPALGPLRDDAIYPHINRREYAHTIYPPVAQLIYFLITRVSESITWMKIVMVGFEALALLALWRLLASFNLPPQRVLIYAWHPLVVWEIAGSGHVDAAVIAFISLALLARRRNWETLTGIMLACATLVKLFPVILFPALYRRWGWRMPLAFMVTTIVLYLPYLSVETKSLLGYLPGYMKEEGLQSGSRFYLLSLMQKVFGETNVPKAIFIVFALIILVIVALWTFWKSERMHSSFVARAFTLAATFTLLLSPRYSWYFVWLTPFMCILRAKYLTPFFYLTIASFVLYGLWLGDQPDWILTLNTIIYLPFALLGVLALGMYRAGKMR